MARAIRRRMPGKRMLCVALLTSALRAAEAAPPVGTPLYLELPSSALAQAVGGAGFVTAGAFNGGGGLLWLPTSGVVEIGGTVAVAVSLDGKTIVGNAFDRNVLENAAIWAGGRDWRVLGSFAPNAQPCDRLLSSAYGTSEDGKVIVGLGWNGCSFARAFRWEEPTGMVDLGSTVAGRSSRANAVSGDGQIVVGWQEDTTGVRLGAKWVGRTQELIRGPFGPVGEAHAANRDGSIIVGSTCNFFSLQPTAWIWRASGGVTCSTVQIPSTIVQRPYLALMQATSDDGRVIGGALSFGLDAESVVWFDGEPVFLKDYLRANGVPNAFEGWVNTGFVNGVTPDGRILVGFGAGRRDFQGFMVILPEQSK
jgi:probable HAF family extracellular repeat protein